MKRKPPKPPPIVAAIVRKLQREARIIEAAYHKKPINLYALGYLRGTRTAAGIARAVWARSEARRR